MACTKKQLRGQDKLPYHLSHHKKGKGRRKRAPAATAAAAAEPEAAEATDAVVASPVSPDDLQFGVEGDAE